MKNILLSGLIGLVIGAVAMAFFRPAPAIQVDHGQTTYTQQQLDSIRTAVRDSTTKAGKITSTTRTVVVSGKGKVDTVETTRTDTLDYTEYTESNRIMTEAVNRQTQVYQEWLDSLKSQNGVVGSGQDAPKRTWMGVGAIIRLSSGAKWPPAPDEATLGLPLRFGSYDCNLVPDAGYNWKRREGRVGIAYKQTFW